MTDLIQGIEFDSLEPIRVPVKLAGKHYVLREATGHVAAQYKNKLMASTELGPDSKPVKVRNLADLDPWIVANCLRDENDLPVKEQTVRSWPSHIVEALATRAKRISGIDTSDEDEEETKNE